MCKSDSKDRLIAHIGMLYRRSHNLEPLETMEPMEVTGKYLIEQPAIMPSPLLMVEASSTISDERTNF
jgi:hypothetical protein